MNALRSEAEIHQLIRMTRRAGSLDKQLAIIISEMYLLLTEDQTDQLFTVIEKKYCGKDLLT